MYNMSRMELNEMSREMTAALEKVAEKYKVTMRVSHVRQRGDGTGADLNVEVLPVDDSAARRLLNVYGRGLGLDENALHVQFDYAGKLYEFVGVNPNAPKYPVKAKSVQTGQTWRLPHPAINAIKLAVERKSKKQAAA